MTRQQLAARLARIQAALVALGPIHPGSLSTQYNVCGTPGCQCKAPRAPQKHGPYHQLSYTWRGKSTTRFVRPGRVAILRAKLARYQRFRALTAEWVDVAIALEALERQAANAEAECRRPRSTARTCPPIRRCCNSSSGSSSMNGTPRRGRSRGCSTG